METKIAEEYAIAIFFHKYLDFINNKKSLILEFNGY